MGKSGFTIIESFEGVIEATFDWLTDGGGTGATAIVTESGGVITDVQPNALGSGFTFPPTIVLSEAGVNGKGAIIKGVITNGQVTSYVIVSGGLSFTGPVTAAVTGGGFALPDNFPDELLTFLHLDFNLIIDGTVSIFKNGIPYPINNDQDIIGVAFRSLPIRKGDVFQIRCDTDQEPLQFTLALEE